VLDELAKQALVGTGRSAPALPRADGPLGEALTAVGEGSPEAKLLAAATVLSQYEACGRSPARHAPPVATPAPPDAKPECSRRAGALLGHLLAMTNTPAKHTLTAEWLELAGGARQRVPHRLLPDLLEYGASYRASRQRIADATDARGAWLMSLNPRWQFAAGEQVDHRALWETGSAEQRVSSIRRLRESDPAAARDLVMSTWKQDGADERAKFVEAMRTSLGADDEPFLEAALDDRSKQVRAAAADLLARLPESAFVRRMIERAGPMLQFTPGAPGGLLKRAKAGKLDVTLPPEKFDAAWSRDGITEKSDERIGQRQWRLVQVVSSVPPAHWSRAWGAEPEAIVAAAGATEHADKLLLAWTRAATRHPDPDWVAALLRVAVAGAAKRPPEPGLLAALPLAERLTVLAEILESPKVPLDAVAQWIGAAEFALDRRAASAALARVEQRILGVQQYDYHAAHLLEHLALRVPPELHDELAARWTGGAWESNRATLDKFFQTLAMRRDIQREFAK
jgi:hypothetical protein